MPSGRVRWLVWGLLAGGVLQAALGVYQFVFPHWASQFPPAGPLHACRRDFRTTEPLRRLFGPDTACRSRPLPERAHLPVYSITRTPEPESIGQAPRPRHAVLGPVRWPRPLRLRRRTAAVIGLGLLASWSRGGWLGAVCQPGRRTSSSNWAARSRPPRLPRSPSSWPPAVPRSPVSFPPR